MARDLSSLHVEKFGLGGHTMLECFLCSCSVWEISQWRNMVYEGMSVF